LLEVPRERPIIAMIPKEGRNQGTRMVSSRDVGKGPRDCSKERDGPVICRKGGFKRIARERKEEKNRL